MNNLFLWIYRRPISQIVLTMLLCCIFWCILGAILQKKKGWKWFNIAVFLGILGGILYRTLCRDHSVRVPIWIPFYTFVKGKIYPELYRAALMNVFLFQPVGLSLPNILHQRKHPIAATLLFSVLLSVCIEAAQFFFCLGLCEMDDIIANTLGTAIGATAYWGASALRRKTQR